MSTRGHNSPIGEHDLLEWVEGTLAPERESAVLRALAGDPELARFMEQLRDDRVAMSDLPRERVPPLLAERLSETVERQLLLGAVEDGTPLYDELPRHKASGPRRRLIPNVFGDTTGRLLLVAAMVLIALGAAAYVASIGLSAFERPSFPQGRELAAAPEPVSADEVIDTDAGTTEPVGEAAPVELARIEPEAEPIVEAPEPMTSERAIALLGEGRLAVRVRPDSPARAVTRLDRLVKRGDEQPGRWRVRADVPDAIVAAVRPSGTEAFDERVRQLWTIMADDGARAPTIDPGPLVDDAPVITGVYSLDLEPTEEDLVAAVAALRSQTGAPVELIELDEPVSVPGPVEVRTILWWGRGPEAWVKRVSVPVVVEDE